MKKQFEKKDPYELITNKVIAQLEEGTVPWQKSWIGGASCPANLVSKKSYRGVNAFMLGWLGYSSRYFVSFKQARDLGGSVKKGEKGNTVVFWKFIQKENKETGKEKTIPFLKYSTVFNLDQCKDIEDPDANAEPLPEFNVIEQAESVVNGFIGKPEIKHDEQRAYYSPKLDFVNMPKPETFISNNEYYSTLFHELTHSTGHSTRLNREGVSEPHFFGDPVYSEEELIAELGSLFLCSEVGIDTSEVFSNSSAYIAGWLKKLKANNKMLVGCASKAQKAVDKILGRVAEVTKEKEAVA